MDISVIKRIVIVTKYVALPLPVPTKARNNLGLSQTSLGCVNKIKLTVTTNGWAMSPVNKSEIAKPHRRIWNVVLTNVFLQIAAKMSAFPTTATGEEMAISTEVEKVAVC